MQTATSGAESKSAFVLCFSTLGNWHDVCHRAAAPRRRNRHVTGAESVGRAPPEGTAAGGGWRLAAEFDAPPAPVAPIAGLTWRGNAPLDARPSAPAAVAAATTRRDTAAVASLWGGGGAPRPCRRGGRSVTSPAWTCW